MFKKPKRLKPGDTLAIISQSWGGPAAFPHIYEAGLDSLRGLGFEIVEYPTARMSAEDLYRNPEARAEDINRAFSDPQIQGIVSSIGGDDSVRILRYLDTFSIAEHPKFIIGFFGFHNGKQLFEPIGPCDLQWAVGDGRPCSVGEPWCRLSAVFGGVSFRPRMGSPFSRLSKLFERLSIVGKHAGYWEARHFTIFRGLALGSRGRTGANS